MNLFHALILGIVQGITEFLPISSTAHLVLFPALLKWPDPGLTFDVALHAGTFLAVAWYFWKDVIALFQGLFSSIGDRSLKLPSQRLPWMILLGTIPAGIAGVLLEKKVETTLRSPLLIACSLIGVGLILWAADAWSKRERDIEQASWLDALLVGCSQALALLPGVSRSGATISAGLALGLTREESARFSFLLGLPIIFLSAAYKLKDLAKLDKSVLRAELLPLLVGVAASTVTGYFAIRFLLDYLKRKGMGVFVVYRILLGVFVAFLCLTGTLHP